MLVIIYISSLSQCPRAMVGLTCPQTVALVSTPTGLSIYYTLLGVSTLKTIASHANRSLRSGSNHEDRRCHFCTLLCYPHTGKPTPLSGGSQTRPMRSPNRHSGESWVSVAIRPHQYAALFYRLPRYIPVPARKHDAGMLRLACFYGTFSISI